MTLETGVQIFAVIHFATMGLSHIFAPRAWARFFVWLRDKGHPGVFVVGFMSLGFGSIVAAFHNVWSGIPLVLTLVGWTQVVKAFIVFLFPAIGLRSLGTVSVERPNRFIIAGVILVGLAGLLLYHLVVSHSG